MMQVIDRDRFQAFVQLLAEADPRDLPHRGHVYRCEGDPERRATRLPRIHMAWLQHRYLAVDGHEPLALARRSPKRRTRLLNAGLRVLRPTGTN